MKVKGTLPETSSSPLKRIGGWKMNFLLRQFGPTFSEVNLLFVSKSLIFVYLDLIKVIFLWILPW